MTVFVATFLLSLGVVWIAFEKWSPKIKKALKVADEIEDIVRTLLEICEDRKITRQEIEKLRGEFEDLQEILR